MCDPGGAQLSAQRRAYLDEARIRRAAGLPEKPKPIFRRPRPATDDNKTKRLRELLAEGVGIAAALKQIDAETEPTS